MKKFTVTLTPDHTQNPAFEYIDALRQIIESNYQYAYDKYGPAFVRERVDAYKCVKIAKNVLCNHGFVVAVTSDEVADATPEKWVFPEYALPGWDARTPPDILAAADGALAALHNMTDEVFLRTLEECGNAVGRAVNSKYTIYIDGLDREVEVIAPNKNLAYKIVWDGLTNDEQNSVVIMDCIDIKPC